MTAAIMRAAQDVGVIMKENFNIKTNNIKHENVISLIFKGYKTVRDNQNIILPSSYFYSCYIFMNEAVTS